MTTNPEIRPENLVTPRMLWSLMCPRRFEIEYCKNYRLKGYRPPPWPAGLRGVLRSALRERDVVPIVDQVLRRPTDPLRVEVAVESVFRVYADKIRKLRGNMRGDELERSEKELCAAIEEARRILAHYDTVHPIYFEFAKSDGYPAVDKFVRAELGNSQWKYADRIDGVVLRENLPPAVLVRHFTTSNEVTEVERQLRLKLELIGKMWSATQLMGRPVTTALIDVIRSKAPSVPEPIKCTKCKGTKFENKKGEKETFCSKCGGSGMGGMSQKACDTTLDIWHATASQLGFDLAAESKRCAKTIRKLQERGESFAYRTVVEVPVAALGRWEQDTIATANLIEHYRKEGYWPRNPDACVLRTGYCRYRKVCSHHGDEDVAWFTRVVEALPGLD